MKKCKNVKSVKNFNAKEFVSNHKKGTVLFVGIFIFSVVAICLYVYFSWKADDENLPFFQRGEAAMGGFMSGDLVNAYGVTSIGMTEETFQVENLDTKLLVEEVYVSTNEEITKESKILKISEESLKEAREELESVLREAELAYRAGSIEYEQNLITAKCDFDISVLKGKQALEVYNETVSGLESNVEKAQKELDDTKKEITEYQEMIQDGSYYDYYKVGEYKALYDENYQLLISKMEEWNISWDQITTGGNSGFDNRSVIPDSVSSGDALGGNSNQTLLVLQSLYKVLEQNLKDYEQVLEQCEDAETNAEFSRQTLELGLSSMEKDLTEAKAEYETKMLEAKLAYEKSVTNGERAEKDYETEVEKAKTDYEQLKDDFEDAKTNLDLFENSIGDGYFYASSSGTILGTMVKEEGYLTSESTIFVYSNPEEITVTVSVGQSDIAKISVGDTATIESSEYGSLEGSVTGIDPVSSSGSRTSVTYNVTVTILDNVMDITANQTVSVIFGMGGMNSEKMEVQ